MCEKRFMLQNSCALHAIDEFFTVKRCVREKYLCSGFWVKWRWKCAWKCRSNKLIDRWMPAWNYNKSPFSHYVWLWHNNNSSNQQMISWCVSVLLLLSGQSLAQLYLSRLSMQFWHEVGDCLMKWYLNYNTAWRTWSLHWPYSQFNNSIQFSHTDDKKKTGSVIKSVKLLQCRYFVYHQQHYSV